MCNVDRNRIVNFRFICTKVVEVVITNFVSDMIFLLFIGSYNILRFPFVIQFISVNYYLPHMNMVSSVNIVVPYLTKTATDLLQNNIHFVEQWPSSLVGVT